jgi:hypothetical protein
MLSLYDFNLLSDDEKAAAVWAGTFLGDREENGLRVQLYGVGAFYVEVFYDGLANRILRFRAFKTYDLLAPYLGHIRFNLR